MDSKKKSLLKAISWRVVATTDTFLVAGFVSWWATGTFSVALAGSIAGLEILTKIGIYYFHERAWSKIK